MKFHTMKSFALSLAFLLPAFSSGLNPQSNALAQDATNAPSAVKPVRMGSGAMSFDTVPGWGLRPDGKSAIGPTHGSVVIDKAGNIYTSADQGVYVFSPEGEVVQSYLGGDYTRLHDMEIRQEEAGEFIYGARNANAEGIKFNAASGEVVLRLKYPEESGLNLKQFNPTALLKTAISTCRTDTLQTTSSATTKTGST